MYDIREALRKMDTASSGSVHLFWFVDMPFWERMYADLWEPLHGSPYHAGPKADCLFGVLYQMGIYPGRDHAASRKRSIASGAGRKCSGSSRKRFGARTPEEQKIVDEYVNADHANIGKCSCDLGRFDFCTYLVEEEALLTQPRGSDGPLIHRRILSGSPPSRFYQTIRTKKRI